MSTFTPARYVDLGAREKWQYDNYCYDTSENVITEGNFVAPIIPRTVNDEMVEPLTLAQRNAYRTFANDMERFDKSWEHLNTLFQEKPIVSFYSPHITLPGHHNDENLGQIRVMPLYQKRVADYIEKEVKELSKLKMGRDYESNPGATSYGMVEKALENTLKVLMKRHKFNATGLWEKHVDPIGYQVVKVFDDIAIMVQIMQNYEMNYFVKNVKERGWHHIVNCRVIAVTGKTGESSF